MNQVTIYTKVGCPYCAAAKKHFDDQGVPFEEIDVHATPGAIDKAKELSQGKNIVPIVVEDGRVTVGFGGG
jgi:glutaredoxin 3